MKEKNINMETRISNRSAWGCLCGKQLKLILIRWRKDGHCTNPGGTVNSMVNAKQVIDMSEYIDKYGNNN